MKYCIALAVYLLSHFFAVAQTIRFQPTVVERSIGTTADTVNLHYTVEGFSSIGQSVSVTISEPVSDSVKLRSHFVITSPSLQPLTGANNQGKISLTIFPASFVTTQIMQIRVLLTRANGSTSTASATLILRFTQNISTVRTPPALAIAKTPLGELVTTLDRVLTKYNCDATKGELQMVQPKTLRESLKQVFAKVVLNNEGLVKNGTAANLTVADGVRLSASYQREMGESRYLRFGFNTKLANSFAEIFRDNQFRNDFGLTMGLTQVVGNPGHFFTKISCEDLAADREIQQTQLRQLFNEYAVTDTAALQKRIDYFTEASRVRIGEPNPRFRANYDTLIRMRDTLKTIKQFHKRIYKDDQAAYLIRDSLSAWEVRKAVKWSGYQVKWIDYDVSLPFVGYNLYDRNRRPDTTQSTVMGSLSFTTTFNRVRNTEKVLWYVYGGVQAMLERGLLAVPPEDTLTLKSGDKAILHYDVTDKEWHRLYLFGIGPTISGLAFFGKEKVIGLEAGVSWRHFFYNRVPADKQNLWNARLGVLLSLNGAQEIAKGTFGLFAQLLNYKASDGPLRDRISIGVRAGLPIGRTF